jgi:hypothetical protein
MAATAAAGEDAATLAAHVGPTPPRPPLFLVSLSLPPPLSLSLLSLLSHSLSFFLVSCLSLCLSVSLSVSHSVSLCICLGGGGGWGRFSGHDRQSLGGERLNLNYSVSDGCDTPQAKGRPALAAQDVAKEPVVEANSKCVAQPGSRSKAMYRIKNMIRGMERKVTHIEKRLAAAGVTLKLGAHVNGSMPSSTGSEEPLVQAMFGRRRRPRTSARPERRSTELAACILRRLAQMRQGRSKFCRSAFRLLKQRTSRGRVGTQNLDAAWVVVSRIEERSQLDLECARLESIMKNARKALDESLRGLSRIAPGIEQDLSVKPAVYETDVTVVGVALRLVERDGERVVHRGGGDGEDTATVSTGGAAADPGLPLNGWLQELDEVEETIIKVLERQEEYESGEDAKKKYGNFFTSYKAIK